MSRRRDAFPPQCGGPLGASEAAARSARRTDPGRPPGGGGCRARLACMYCVHVASLIRSTGVWGSGYRDIPCIIPRVSSCFHRSCHDRHRAHAHWPLLTARQRRALARARSASLTSLPNPCHARACAFTLHRSFPEEGPKNDIRHKKAFHCARPNAAFTGRVVCMFNIVFSTFVVCVCVLPAGCTISRVANAGRWLFAPLARWIHRNSVSFSVCR